MGFDFHTSDAMMRGRFNDSPVRLHDFHIQPAWFGCNPEQKEGARQLSRVKKRDDLYLSEIDWPAYDCNTSKSCQDARLTSERLHRAAEE